MYNTEYNIEFCARNHKITGIYDRDNEPQEGAGFINGFRKKKISDLIISKPGEMTCEVFVQAKEGGGQVTANGLR